MLLSLSPWQQPISPWSSNRNPICVRGLARERLVSLQGCSLRKDESSQNFTMLLRLESLFPFSLSPPLVGGNIAVLLGVILLDLDSCILPIFQTLGVLDSWDLAVFFDSCRLSWLLRTYCISWFLGLFMVLGFFMLLVVFQSLVVFRTLLVFRLSRQLYFNWKLLLLSKKST